VTNHHPGDAAVGQQTGLVADLLHLVLAEAVQPQRYRRAHHFGTEGLADRQDGDLGRITPGGAAGLVHAMADVGPVGGEMGVVHEQRFSRCLTPLSRLWERGWGEGMSATMQRHPLPYPSPTSGRGESISPCRPARNA